MSDLIKVTKAGVVLGVHPTCLAAHEALGWTQTEAEINAGQPEEDGPAEAGDDDSVKAEKAALVDQIVARGGEKPHHATGVAKLQEILAALPPAE